MEDLFRSWVRENHPDVIIDDEGRVYRLMFSAFMEGYETGKVDKIDSNNGFVCDFSEGCDGCII